MRLTPLLSAAAATSLLAALATPAAAATPPAPGLGTALSGGSLAKLSAAGQVLEAVRLELPTGTVDGSKALVRIVPLLAGGVPVGQPVEVPAGQERSIPARTAGLPGVVSLTSPGASISALLGPDGPVAAATTTGLGDLKLLGGDVLGNGSFASTSKVGKVGSTATKSLALDGLALPSLLDLLTNLGLDLEALPAVTLPRLLDGLNLLPQVQVEDLLALIDALDLASVGDLVGLGTLDQAGLDALTADLETAEAEALVNLAGATPEAGAAATLLDQIAALSSAPAPAASTSSSRTQAAGDLDAVVDALNGGTQEAPTLTGGSLAPVLGLVDAATETELGGLLADPALDPAALLATLQDVLDQVLGGLLGDILGDLPVPTDDLLGLLDTSLLSLGALDVNTVARSGDVDLADVTGLLAGLEVLGTDVLDAVLGKSEVDLTGLLADKSANLQKVQGAVDGLLKTVTDVLGTAGVTLPLPEVDFLRVVEESVTAAGGTKTSRAGVEAVSLTWALDKLNIPAVSSLTDSRIAGADALRNLPASTITTRNAAMQVPGPPTGQLPGVLTAAQRTSLLSTPLSLVLGDLTDTAVFTAAGAVPPTVVPPAAPPADLPADLPRTGGISLLALTGVALMAAAVVLRRRRLGGLAG